MNALTFLSAFQSECGRKGRVWTRGSTFYRRTIDDRLEYMPHGHEEWKTLDRQIVTMEGEVHWADEPKALKPATALEVATHLGSGGAVKVGHLFVRLRDSGPEVLDKKTGRWDAYAYLGANQLLCSAITTDPSQPAESAKPPLKVGDRVKVRGRGDAVHEIWAVYPSGRVNLLSDDDDETAIFGPDDIEKIEEAAPAEPQVEFPLNYGQALVALHDGKTVNCESDTSVYLLKDGRLEVCGMPSEHRSFDSIDKIANESEKVARWRIVDGGK